MFTRVPGCILTMSLLIFWALNISVVLRSMQGQKALGFNQKYLNLFPMIYRSHKSGTRWGWIINDRIFLFGKTIPVKVWIWEIFDLRHYERSGRHRLSTGGLCLCFLLHDLQMFGQEVLLELRLWGEVERADHTAEHRAGLTRLTAAYVLL